MSKVRFGSIPVKKNFGWCGKKFLKVGVSRGKDIKTDEEYLFNDRDLVDDDIMGTFPQGGGMHQIADDYWLAPDGSPYVAPDWNCFSDHWHGWDEN